MVDNLPTCWYCPECGHVENWPYADGQLHQKPNDGTPCSVRLVESQVLPPGTPPEQILNLVGDVQKKDAMDDAHPWPQPYYVVWPREEAT